MWTLGLSEDNEQFWAWGAFFRPRNTCFLLSPAKGGKRWETRSPRPAPPCGVRVVRVPTRKFPGYSLNTRGTLNIPRNHVLVGKFSGWPPWLADAPAPTPPATRNGQAMGIHGRSRNPSFIYTGKRSLNQVIWSVCFEILKGQGWIQTSRESDAFGLSGSNKGGKTKPEIESLKSYLFNPPTPIHFGTSLVYSCFLWKHLSFEVPHYALK